MNLDLRQLDQGGISLPVKPGTSLARFVASFVASSNSATKGHRCSLTHYIRIPWKPISRNDYSVMGDSTHFAPPFVAYVGRTSASKVRLPKLCKDPTWRRETRLTALEPPVVQAFLLVGWMSTAFTQAAAFGKASPRDLAHFADLHAHWKVDSL